MENELVNKVPPMMIRYRLKADQVEREIELLRPIYEELESTQPDGLSYATFQLEDKVSFVEFVATDGPGRFSQLDSFRAYRATLDERCEQPPVMSHLREVGSFRFLW